MTTVFVSHSSEDRTFLEKEILPRLKSKDINVWYSPQAIESAAEWERAIKTGLEQSDVFVVMMSPSAARSSWVQAELHWAFTERPNRIVPAMIRSCKPADCHLLLGRLQYVDLCSGDIGDALERLIEAVHRAGSIANADDSAPAEMDEDERRAAEKATPLLRLALVCLGRQDYKQALDHASSALQISQHAGAYYVRGLANIGAKNWAPAIEDFSAALLRNPLPDLKPLIYSKRAIARAQLDDDLRAILDCDYAIKLDPSGAEALLTRGMLRRHILQPAKAVEDFSAVISLNPNAIDAYVHRAEAYRELGQVDKAKTDLDVVSRRDPARKVPELSDARLEEARNSLRVFAKMAQWERLPPQVRSQLLGEMSKIGFPKAITDVEYILKNVPEDEPDHKIAEAVYGPLKVAVKRMGS